MKQRNQLGLVWFLLGILAGMFVLRFAPSLLTTLVLVLAIGLLAAMAEMRYHLLQQLIRQLNKRRASAPPPPAPRAQQSQQSQQSRIQQTQQPRMQQSQQSTSYRRRNVHLP